MENSESQWAKCKNVIYQHEFLYTNKKNWSSKIENHREYLTSAILSSDILISTQPNVKHDTKENTMCVNDEIVASHN
ncbi:hypothetical protein GWI33_016701 [Rhynchophorus ferrugineus]|uniref:Uncharacterized protein n=1 Tax=Rhynchophorus ferrugineus TaxID=354439 RepID=A0A834I345_RHYFE|nr:hypothetical protein GWI33_016701 [Rhynchophorus ferrugineus]